MGVLWVEFAGEHHQVADRLTFGRQGDLALDEANRFMHRLTGEFVFEDDAWWLHNRGEETRLVLFGMNGARAELPPGTSMVLPGSTGTVSLIAGPTPYQLTYRSDVQDFPKTEADQPGDPTYEFGTPLSRRETQLMTSFALRRLTGSGDALLSYAEVADIWGIAEKTVENTLNRLRVRTRDAGVTDIDTLESLLAHQLAHGRIGIATLLAVEAEKPEVVARYA